MLCACKQTRVYGQGYGLGCVAILTHPEISTVAYLRAYEVVLQARGCYALGCVSSCVHYANSALLHTSKHKSLLSKLLMPSGSCDLGSGNALCK